MTDTQMKYENDPRLDIELLKKDILMVNDICKKLDTTIEKLEELTVSMTKILSLHEQRLEYHEKRNEELDKLIELRRNELLSDIKELHSRVTTVNRELTTQLESTKQEITKEIKLLKDCITTQHNNSSHVLEQIQRWKWMILGGTIAIAWLISNVNLSVLSRIFK